MSVVWTSRSQLESWEKCPRLTWWRYHYNGTGLEGYGIQLEAECGTAIHLGIEQLLVGSTVGTAAARGTAYITSVLAADPTPLNLLTDARRFEYEEAYHLVDACIRGWALARLPRILSQGKCLSIEREHPVKFTLDSGQQVGLQTRPDIVWQRSTDGAIFIRNIKTTKVVDDKFKAQWKIDMQTLSEPLAVEATLGQPVSGVIVEGVAKGKKLDFPASALPDLAGKYYHNNPLLYGWHREAEPPLTREDWQHRYEWIDLNGGQRRLGRGYRKVPIWRGYPGGIAAWIDHVWNEDASAFDDLFVELEPILRSDYEIERWRRQTLHDIYNRDVWAKIVQRAKDCELHPELDPAMTADELLDTHFPMHTSNGNCIWPRKCTYYECCHGSAGTDPIGSGLFRVRTPHHPVPVED